MFKLSFKISNLPSKWTIIPSGLLFFEKSIKNTKNEINLSVYRDYGVIKRDSRDDNHNRVSDDISNYKLVEVGDLVLNKMKGWMGSIGISEYRGIVSPSYTVMETNREIDNKFFNYLFRSEYYRQIYDSLSYGVRVGQWELRYHDFKKIPCLYPPITEQKKISSFLDNKTKKINILILKIKKKISILEEKKNSIIYKYITKSIDAKIELKDSKIKLIGKIPKHWQLSKIGRHFKIERGRVISNVDILENLGQYPVYSSQTKNNGELGLINTYDFDGEYVSWTTDGANAGTCFHRKGKFNVTNVCGLLSSHELRVDYLFLTFYLNLITKNYIRLDINPKLMNDMMSEIPFIIVPIEEQIKIVKKIKTILDSIDKTIFIETKRIEKLSEFKTCLISSLVVGIKQLKDSNE